ncbi:hypothetical protein BJ165DRAFT_1448034 [Panaeolus papilionaceus]|nr:hypothetical protein BJ165DRAFT_1448034 [Panaeolus papilionaceus]
MSSNLPAFVVVESSSPDIRYEGAWTPVNPASSSLAHIPPSTGPTVSDQLYSAPQGVSSLIYNFFAGEEIFIIGTLDASAQTIRVIACEVDSIGGFSNFVGNLAWGTSASHNVVLCHVRDLWPGNHRLNLTIELLENDGFIPAVLFDHFEIKPSSSTILDDAFLLLNPDHPAITYDEHWNRSAQTLPLGFRYTNTPGSIVAINFNGTSLRWYNGWNNELSGKETTATWSIDGGQPTTFTIAGVTNPTYGGGFVDLQLDIRNLAPGPHHLEVIYGNVGRPLALDKLIIYNSLPDPTFKPPMTTSNPSLDLRPTGATDGGGRSGGISSAARISIGVNIGIGALIFGTIAYCFIYWRKRKQRLKTPNPASPNVDTSLPARQVSATSGPCPPCTSLGSPSDFKGTPVTPQWLHTSQTLLNPGEGDGASGSHHKSSATQSYHEDFPPPYLDNSGPRSTFAQQ